MRTAILMCFMLSTIASYGQLQLFGVLPEPTTYNTTFRISHSMGEPFVQQQSISPYLVTEGFQQGDVPSVVAGTDQAQSWNISFSPNPVMDLLQVKWTDPALQKMELLILRADGIVVSRQNISTAQATIYMGHVKPGTYIIRGFDPEGNQIIQQKIVKI